MKYLKYVGLVIILLVVGYITLGFIQKKNFDNQLQIDGEGYAIEIFGRVSSQHNLKFSSYREAKNFFQEKAHTDKISNLIMYTSFNQLNNVPVLGAIISSNYSENRCIYGRLNLVTGEFFTEEDVCIILN